ncbi:Uncharacterised protein [Mycobacterium tuberculosis]|nr:Uncharacterised protein [Mycobacterium tuberculosis]CNV38968.1 Uncharacterised protein [Mycobacterium tuberculosis]
MVTGVVGGVVGGVVTGVVGGVVGGVVTGVVGGVVGGVVADVVTGVVGGAVGMVGIPGCQPGNGGMMIGTGIGTGAGTTPGTAGASGAGEAGVPPTPGEVPGRGTTFCTAGMVPPWNPAVGSSGGGGGTGACCCVGNNGMNFPGWAFWCPSTGFEAAVGRMVTATATASEAKPITAKATTALPISSDRRLNGAERSAAAPYSSCSSYSSTGSSS